MLASKNEIFKNIKPPFNSDIIETFNQYQNSCIFHSYTCGKCSNILSIKTENLFCNKCDYTQDTITILPSLEVIKESKDKLNNLFKK